MLCLLISVRLHDGRYHGAGDWPPSPARLFQALVAGAARGSTLADTDRQALAWLEGLAAPVIAAPATRRGQGFRNYVPNNDLDAVGGDMRRIGEIRAPKAIRPNLFDPAQGLLYAWFFPAGESNETRARAVAATAEKLYQLGRGVDMAWASAEIVAADEAEAHLAEHGGVLHRPGQAGTGTMLACPEHGSLRRLEERFRANRRRFTTTDAKGEQLFSQAPKPRFRAVPYECPPVRRLFDLRPPDDADRARSFPWPLTQAVALATTVRDLAAARLKKALPEKAALIDRVLIGRNATEADKAARVRIVPLPSIGHVYADREIRRVLVEIPPNCPLPPAPILERGFSGMHLGTNPETGEIVDERQPILAPAGDDRMLRHYGIGLSRRIWRSVTPVALPRIGGRRRSDPARLNDSARHKGAAERSDEENRAARAAVEAVRHAGVAASVATVRVQREPFAARGERTEMFAPGTRFARERLWHVEVTFAEPVTGPVILGDGRYLGLGLMEPTREPRRDLITFTLESDAAIAAGDRIALLQAVRRALMARARRDDGGVPRLFSGHESGGAAARSGRHEHIFLAAVDLDGDGYIERLVVAAPWRCDRAVRSDPTQPVLFERVVSSLAMVRAGRLGVIRLDVDALSAKAERLTGPARIWESHTRYRPTQPVRHGEVAEDIVLDDLAGECRRRGLPVPAIELLELADVGALCVAARLRLRFAAAIAGPVLLGRDSHQGGGLFLAAGNDAHATAAK